MSELVAPVSFAGRAGDPSGTPSRLLSRLSGGLVAGIVAIVAVFGWIVVSRENAAGRAELQVHLKQTGTLVAELLAPTLASGDSAALARMADVARPLGLRMTVVAVDGRVLADSAADAAKMENHLDRPEIRAALRAGVGEARRVSATTGEHELYYAVAVVRDGALHGVLRIAGSDADLAPREASLLHTLEAGLSALVIAVLCMGFVFMRGIEQKFRREKDLLVERHGLYEELKANEAALVTKERRLSEAQDIARLGSWTWDVRTNAVTWSDSLYRMFDIEPGTIAPTFDTYMSFVHPDELTFISDALGDALRTKEPFEYDQRIVRRDGTVRVVHARGEVLTDADGTPTMMVGTALDVTERALAEDAHRRSEERFQLAMRATNDALWDWVPGTNVIWWSDAFYTLFGYGRAEIELTFDARIALMHPEDREAVAARLDDFLKSDVAVFTCDYRIRRADGAYAWISDRAYAVRDSQNRPVRIIGSMMDITVRKAADRMKSDFVSFVSHQLRTPLSGMNWMLELASDAAGLPDEARGYIAEARESAERLGGLVNDLLDVSRLESGRLVLTLEDVHLEAVTRSVIDEARALIAERGHRITVESRNPPASVHVDAQLMRQAIANLVSNAIKYTPAGGTIQVIMTRENGQQQWTVVDSGIGIPKPAQAQLFDKFFRADNAVAMVTEGTGLGLHLVRLIVEQFGGTVWCDSEEGQGTKFSFALPVAEVV